MSLRGKRREERSTLGLVMSLRKEGEKRGVL